MSVYQRFQVLLLILIPTFIFSSIIIYAQDTEPPEPRYRINCFGKVRSATVTDMPSDAEIRSNLASIELLSYDNYTLDYEEIIPGETITTLWELTVDNPDFDAYAEIKFTDLAGNDTIITIDYFATRLNITPQYYDFGKITPGNPKSQVFELTNERDVGVFIGKAELQKGNNGFSVEVVGSKELPYFLEKGDNIKFMVTFDNYSMGTFQDSLYIWDYFANSKEEYCHHEAAYLRARIGDPIINVSDADFGESIIGHKITKNITITNNGEANLQLTGYKGPKNTVNFEAYLPPSYDFYREIEPGESYEFEVYFTPSVVMDYQDTIIFSSDAPTQDSICVLSGKGIDLDVFMTPEYDFGSQSVSTPSYPIDPYEKTEPFVITNNSPMKLTVLDARIEQVGSSDISAFIFEPNNIIGTEIPANDRRFADIKFLPTEKKSYEGKLIVELTNDIILESTIRGVGSSPELFTKKQIAFNNALVGSGEPVEKTIRIENQSSLDTLILIEISHNPVGAVSDDGTNYGSEYFKYDKNEIYLNGVDIVNGFPIIIPPNEFIEFKADYLPQEEGVHAAEIIYHSNFIDDPVSSHWTGNSIEDKYNKLEILSLDYQIYSCPQQATTFFVEIQNNADEELNLNSDAFSINDNNGYYSLSDYQEINVSADITLQPGQKIKVYIDYAPLSTGQHKALFNVSTPSKIEQYQKITMEISADSKLEYIDSKGLLSADKVEKGDRFTYLIAILPANPLRSIQTDSLDISFTYSGESMEIDAQSIRKGSGLDDSWIIAEGPQIYADPNSFDRRVSVLLVSPEEKIIDELDIILQADFNTFLTAISNEGQKPTYSNHFQISHDLNTFTHCVEPGLIEPAIINIKPVCADTLSYLQVSSDNYSFAQIAPHPFDGNVLSVDFSIAYEAHTTIEIISVDGLIVARPIDQMLKKGKHTVNIDVSALSSGVYRIVLRSAQFVASQSLVIIR